MEKKKENKLISNIVQTQVDGIELKSVKNISEENDGVKQDHVAIDMPDQGCSGCSANANVVNQEDVSMSSSSDDYTEQEMSITKKSTPIAYKGMMDIALLTANANQLRFLILYNAEEKMFYISATLIVLSLIIQVMVGIGVILKRRMKNKGLASKADKMGTLVLSGMFCLAVINVLVVSFTT